MAWFSEILPDVAKHLRGEPNKHLSKPDHLRFGTNGSLSVEKKNGQWTWYDHEQEKGGGTLDLVRQETGLVNGAALSWMQERFKVEPPQSDRVFRSQDVFSQSREVVFDYFDEQGELLYQVVKKTNPKKFFQRVPDGNGGYSFSLDGVRRVLFRLPELLNPAVSAGKKLVFIVEGEKDAECLGFHGLLATCNAQGAGKWVAQDDKPSYEYGEALRGAKVILIPDNDEAGYKHIRQVAADLKDKASAIMLLELPGLPHKGDVSDWMVSHTIEEFKALAKAAKPYDFDDEPAFLKGSSPIGRADEEADRADDGGEAREDDSGGPVPRGGNEGWQDRYVLDSRENVRSCLANAILILENHVDWDGVIAYDAFAHKQMMMRPAPWIAGDECKAFKPREWRDSDDILTTRWLQTTPPNLIVNDGIGSKAVSAVAEANAFNPVKARLKSLKWDQVNRLETWLPHYLGAEKTKYTADVGKAWMIGAVARVMNPGSKFDTMLILEGPQGARKSTACRLLALESDWFSDQMPDLSGGKAVAEYLQGKWIVEIAELDGMVRSEISRVKAFISSQIDRFRVAYGRHAKDFRRSCAFIGSVNPEGGYLKDATGGRRFWPVEVGNIRIELLEEVVEQLWAEAVVKYEAGEPWWLDDEATKLAQVEQADRHQEDPWQYAVETFLTHEPTYSEGLTGKRMKPVSEWQSRWKPLDEVTTSEILSEAFEIPMKNQTKADQMRVSGVLTKLGMKRVKVKYKTEVGTTKTKWVYRTLAEVPT